MDLNYKSKNEQLFLLLLGCTAVFGLFCFTGCGRRDACEKIQCGKNCEDGTKMVGISIPGCGGCLTSGKGCNSCLWPQSCKAITFCTKEERAESEYLFYEEYDTEYAAVDEKMAGCDIRYYDGGGCLSCGQRVEESCNFGCVNVKWPNGNHSARGCFFDSCMLGCTDGHVNCTGINSELWDYWEEELGID